MGMERARAAIHAEWVPDALSRSRWSAAHTLKEIEAAEAEATGKRQCLIAEAREGMERVNDLLGEAQATRQRTARR